VVCVYVSRIPVIQRAEVPLASTLTPCFPVKHDKG
jgi:hypothetical protein